MADLASLFELEELDAGVFATLGQPRANKRLSLYGGLVMAQALRAAGMTIDAARAPHSLHGYFLRPGRIDRPVILHVDRIRDGGSFSARQVRALQDDEPIFAMFASFHEAAPGVLYDVAPTRGGDDPERLPGRTSPLLVEIREVTPTRIGDGQIRHSDRLWVRAEGRLPDDPLMHACGVVYVSDLGSGFGQVEIEGLGVDGPSIEHDVWFHAPIRADEWMLLELWPFKASGGRGLYQGSVRSRSGVLGAVLAQEMLLRDRVLPAQVLGQMVEYLGLVPPGG